MVSKHSEYQARLEPDGGTPNVLGVHDGAAVEESVPPALSGPRVLLLQQAPLERVGEGVTHPRVVLRPAPSRCKRSDTDQEIENG